MELGMLCSAVSSKVQESRLELGYGLGEFAERCGISKQTLWRLERGEVDRISFGTVARILNEAGYRLDVQRGTLLPTHRQAEDESVAEAFRRRWRDDPKWKY